MALYLSHKPLLTTRHVRPISRPSVARITCQAQKDEQIRTAMALPLASMVAAAMIAGAFAPEEALAARSSGRAGGSSFSSRRSAPAPS